jgi:spore coat-associated protein N
MSIKKKLGTSLAAGALGLSLVAGGTYAAFNDVESLSNSIAAGTLDLVVNEGATTLFEVSDMKPGDTITRTLTLHNNGSLEIDEILLSSVVSGWDDVLHTHLPDVGDNSKDEFLGQFTVKVTDADGTIIFGNSGETLADLQALDGTPVTGDGEGFVALDPSESMSYEIVIEFTEDSTKYENSAYYVQNKYQGERFDLALTFEATQMPGEEK